MNNAVKFRSVNYGGLVFGGAYAFSNSSNGFSNNNAYTAAGRITTALEPRAAYFQANIRACLAPANTGGALSSGDGNATLVGVASASWVRVRAM